MKPGAEILQMMISAAGLESEEDLAAMFGVDEEWIREILPSALEFIAAYCEICEQNPTDILGLQAPAGMTGRHRDREEYFAATQDRIGVAAGRFEIENIIDEDTVESEKLFKGLMAENAGKLNFDGCVNEDYVDLERKNLFEKINAAYSEGPDPAEQGLLNNIRRLQTKTPRN